MSEKFSSGTINPKQTNVYDSNIEFLPYCLYGSVPVHQYGGLFYFQWISMVDSLVFYTVSAIPDEFEEIHYQKQCDIINSNVQLTVLVYGNCDSTF